MQPWTGAGVEGSVVQDGTRRRLKFGSVDYVTAVMSPSNADAVRAMAEPLSHNGVVSVLLDAPEASTSGSDEPSSIRCPSRKFIL